MDTDKFNCMEYIDEMEVIDSNVMDKVLEGVKSYNYWQYTGREVERALLKDRLTINDFAAILSPAALPYLEDAARRASLETKKKFGNAVSLFTPLYIANYCDNHCLYCGFHCKNQIKRARLSLEEIEKELQKIALTGLRDILLLTGESRRKSGVAYIGEAVKLASKYFPAVGIEIPPLNTAEYNCLNSCGADYVSVYQETYNTERYAQVHLSGPKRSFPYRFHAQERALAGGMRGVAFGALFGLADYHKDAFAAGLHAFLVQKKYPHAEISFSVPRLRSYVNNECSKPNNLHERQLLQAMLAYRLFMPYAGITISTRESAQFRDHVVGIAATRISAGVKVGVSGHKDEAKGDQQFEISDLRNVSEMHQMLLKRGLQPVYNDYVRV